jgi:hypothetical protein
MDGIDFAIINRVIGESLLHISLEGTDSEVVLISGELNQRRRHCNIR